MAATLVKSPQEMESFAETFVRERFLHVTSYQLPVTSVVCLHGDLGSGKTTFVQGVGKALGVEGTMASPTFVLEKVYKLAGQPFEHLIHVDAYRLSGGDELLHLGFEEILRDPGNIVFIEWAENVAEALPENRIAIYFTFVDEKTREIKIQNPNIKAQTRPNGSSGRMTNKTQSSKSQKRASSGIV